MAGDVRKQGSTLLELMFAVAIMTIVMGTLFTLSFSIGDTAQLQDVKITNIDEGRRALLGIVPRVRQAHRASVNYEDMPTDVLRFRMPEDIDDNGLAIDRFNTLELGDEITIRRDKDDVNKDGVAASQLVMIQGETVTVLANELSPDEAPDPEQVVAGEVLENTAGFWVETNAGRLTVTIRTEGTTRRGQKIRQQFTQIVEPRN